MVEDQGVAIAAAGGGEQDRGVNQRIEVDQVEQVLELARVGASVDRRRHHQQVGGLDGA
ncbi:hypothetical protein FQZ97_1172490 [compost metagenome]